jgi:5-methylcytosine-specific restriction protein A
MSTTSPFSVGGTYSRDDVQRILGLEPADGGPWYTGYHEYNGEFYLFPNIGVAGSTGHDYANRWLDGELHWSAKGNARAGQPLVERLLAPGARVHLFTRDQQRDPFTYQGLVVAGTVDRQSIPIRVVWRRTADVATNERSNTPDEVRPARFVEGATRQVTVNAFERNPAARRACIAHHGTQCAACGLNMAERYGPIAEGYIHVHHTRPLAHVGQEYTVDPVVDLVPLCPNCHCVAHLADPPLEVGQIKTLIAQASS